jgi:hypothetical protein
VFLGAAQALNPALNAAIASLSRVRPASSSLPLLRIVPSRSAWLERMYASSSFSKRRTAVTGKSSRKPCVPA